MLLESLCACILIAGIIVSIEKTIKTLQKKHPKNKKINKLHKIWRVARPLVRLMLHALFDPT